MKRAGARDHPLSAHTAIQCVTIVWRILCSLRLSHAQCTPAIFPHNLFSVFFFTRKTFSNHISWEYVFCRWWAHLVYRYTAIEFIAMTKTIGRDKCPVHAQGKPRLVDNDELGAINLNSSKAWKWKMSRNHLPVNCTSPFQDRRFVFFFAKKIRLQLIVHIVRFINWIPKTLSRSPMCPMREVAHKISHGW